MSFANSLISWYELNKRDLPWRQTKDPYFIWLSEIIMQQTRVAQGTPYYERFIELFSTVDILADAPEQTVMKAWQGLGYYSRARNLHFTAKQIKNEHQNLFPDSYEKLLKLKGVGTYTAAAIASIAFKEPVAVVDGNVYRVLARYFGIYDAQDSTIGKKIFAKLAQEVMSIPFPDIYNQAIMEFGALQCKPGLPDCGSCILNENCIAFLTNSVSLLPVKTKKTKVRNRFFYYFVIEYGNGFYMKKRTAKDVWVNLYDFPLIEKSEAELNPERLILSSGFIKLSDTYTIENISKEYKHVLSHQHIYARFIEINVQKPIDFENTEYQLIDIDYLKKMPVSKLIENYLEMKIIKYI